MALFAKQKTCFIPFVSAPSRPEATSSDGRCGFTVPPRLTTSRGPSAGRNRPSRFAKRKMRARRLPKEADFSPELRLPTPYFLSVFSLDPPCVDFVFLLKISTDDGAGAWLAHPHRR